MSVRLFQRAAVGFPAGGEVPPGAWDKVRWIYWATGDLEIHTGSFSITFTPEGRRAAKSLGVLSNAWIIPNPDDENLAAFVATTSDPVHSVVRFDFSSSLDEEAFAGITDLLPGRRPASGPDVAARRSSLGGASSRRSSVSGLATDAAIPEFFRNLAQQKFPGQAPIIVSGVELYGPEPSGEPGTEVLLGRGALFLVDPCNEPTRVGIYELFFFDEGCIAPMLRLQIGPRLRLEPSREPVGRFSLDGPGVTGRASIVARRRSSVPGAVGAPTSFDLYVTKGGMWGLIFDREADATNFTRDFSVRQRLMHLSMQTYRGWRTVGEFREEVEVMRRQGFFATLRRFLLQFVIVAVLSWVLYVLALYNNDDKPLLDIMQRAAQDTVDATALFFDSTLGLVDGTCRAVTGCVSPVEIVRCEDMWEPSDPWSGRNVHGCLRIARGGSFSR